LACYNHQKHNGEESSLIVEETQEESQAIDPVFKQIVEEEFAAYQARCQTEYEVGRLPRTIDALITIEDEAERLKIRTETPFFYLLKDNQLEFKGRRDPLTPKAYSKIRGRMEFLLSGKAMSPETTTVTIISAGKPRSVFTYAKDKRKQPFVATAEKGYYKTEEQPLIYLIVVNELPVMPKNYPLLLFASDQRKFRKFLQQMIVEGQRTYIRYAYEVRPQVTKEVLTMAGISARISRKDLEFMASDIGRELVAVMNPKDVLSAMNPKDVLSAMNPKDVLSAMNPKDVLEGLDTEKQKKLIALLSPSDLLSGISMEEFLQGINAEQRKALFESVLKMLASDLAKQGEHNGNGSSA
jgi:hypothetical protein